MTFEWNGKRVLITGASKGIGAELVRKALAEGVQHITNLDVDVENGVALQNELNEKYRANKVTFIKCDVTNEDQLRGNLEVALADKSQQHVVINNAAILNDSLRTYKKQIEINVTSVVTSSLIALELMRKDRGGTGGTIINISSTVALCPLPHTPIYNCTKSAVLVFSTGLGADDYYQRTDVRVLTMCFGLTDTGLVSLDNLGTFDEEMQRRFFEPLGTHPLQSVDSAAQGVIDMYKRGASASVWLANANKPVEDITAVVTKAYTDLTAVVFK